MMIAGKGIVIHCLGKELKKAGGSCMRVLRFREPEMLGSFIQQWKRKSSN